MSGGTFGSWEPPRLHYRDRIDTLLAVFLYF